jgi:5-methylcytosine-specific restriction endonuclease McrA
VHHRTYIRLGRERAADLTTLCQACHDIVTLALRQRRYRKRPLPDITSVAPPMLRVLIDSTEEWRHV